MAGNHEKRPRSGSGDLGATSSAKSRKLNDNDLFLALSQQPVMPTNQNEFEARIAGGYFAKVPAAMTRKEFIRRLQEEELDDSVSIKLAYIKESKANALTYPSESPAFDDTDEEREDEARLMEATNRATRIREAAEAEALKAKSAHPAQLTQPTQPNQPGLDRSWASQPDPAGAQNYNNPHPQRHHGRSASQPATGKTLLGLLNQIETDLAKAKAEVEDHEHAKLELAAARSELETLADTKAELDQVNKCY